MNKTVPCAIIQADEAGRVKCPYCGKRLPGRYPDGISRVWLQCRTRGCAGRREFEICILSASQQLQQFSAP